MVLFVLCFGVKFLCCLNLKDVFEFLVRFGYLMAAYSEIVTQSAYYMFS